MNMNFRNRFRLVSALAVTGCVCTIGNWANGQEEKDQQKTDKKTRIRIVDRDGQELKSTIITGKATTDGESVDLDVKVNGGVDLINGGDGVIIIRDADGNEQKIKAVSIMVSQSQKTVVENGEERNELVKKAIVVDADGKTYEIDLSNGELTDGPKGALVMTQSSVGKYMIGVVAQPASEALAEQLNLEPGSGLVVQQISPESPAAKAGLQENDVLLFANQRALKTTEDLVEEVQKAGAEKVHVSLTLIRDEKEMSVEVTPQERNMAMLFRAPGFNFDQDMGDFQFDWAQAGPGFVFNHEDFDPEAMKAQIEKMREQHRIFQDRMKEAFDLRKEAMRLREEARQNIVPRDQMQELLDEIKRLREEVESLKKDRDKN